MIPKYGQTKKQSWQNIFFIILMSSLVLIIVVFLVVSNVKISRKRAILNSQISQLQEQIRAMEEKKQQMQAQLSQSTTSDYLEKKARETLNLKKPGEEVVVVLPQEGELKQEGEKEKYWWNPLTW